jgi:AraC-like DNA-binding protein
MKNRTRTSRLYHLADSRPNLKRLGIDLEYFSHYVNLAPHFHSLDIVLLSFIIQGTGTHLMEDDAYSESGVSLGVTHYGQRHTIVTGRDGMDIMNMYLDLKKLALPVLPPPLSGVLPSIIPLHPSFGNRLNRIVRIQFDGPTEPVVSLVFSMQRELENREQGYEESLMLYFKQFLIICCRQVLKNGVILSTSTTHSSSPHIEQLRQYLDGHCTQALTLKALAAKAGVTPTYLCRAFKRHTGKSVFEYLLDRRVQAAMMALRSSDKKIAAIALESGFNDLAHFNRVFKKRAGRRPGEYRNYR